MNSLRLISLTAVLVCVWGLSPLFAQTQSQTSNTQAAQPAQQNPPAAAPAPASQQKANPFETVPQSPTHTPPAQTPAAPPAQGTKPPFETLPQTPAVKPVVGNQNVIEAIEFRGSRRVPQETLRGMIVTRKGDVYNEETLRRDFHCPVEHSAFRRHPDRN